MDVQRLLSIVGFGRGSQVRTLGRGIILAGLVGAASGVAAIVFHALCQAVVHLALERGAGYDQGGPAHETWLPFIGDSLTAEALQLIPWMLILIPPLGGLISGLLCHFIAPEAAGAGTDPALRAYHQRRGLIPLRVPLVKMFASAITLGTGGSGGREGPIALIGAGFGSFIATKLQLSDAERRVLMAAGLGAGIGAIFHAPLAGAIFAIEVLYRDPDFEAEALIPAFIATAVAYSVFSLAYGFGAFQPLFHVDTATLALTKPLILLPWLAILAIAMAGMSYLFIRALHGSQTLFERLSAPAWIKPAIGGLVTGLLGLSAYYAASGLDERSQHDALSVLSFGYGFLQRVLAGELPAAAWPALAILLIVGLGKVVTTAASIGSGGSGGVFGPSMIIGGSMGAAVGVVLHAIAPGFVAEADVVVFAILGMASFFAAAANTPVSTLIMVSELTNSYALLLPSMWVCAIAYLFSRNWTLYREQVANRLESPAHRGDFIVDILKGMSVGDAITDQHRRFITVLPATPLAELSRMITSTFQSAFPVVDEAGRYHGVFSLNDIRQFLYDSDLGPLAVAEDLADADVEPLSLHMDLSDAISRFAKGRFDELPVMKDVGSDEVVAMLRRQDVITVYDKRLLEMRSE
jgi:CIC family chloride channel protein